MSVYRVELLPAAQKQLRRIDSGPRRRIDEAIRALGGDPRPHGCRKLAGADDRYRIRVGDYRILYVIGDAVLRVLVVKVGHRRDVYE